MLLAARARPPPARGQENNDMKDTVRIRYTIYDAMRWMGMGMG